MKRIFAAFILIPCLILISSCFLQKKHENVNLEVFNDLGPGKEWAIITEPYIAFYTEPAKTSVVSSHGRKADILEIQGKRIIIGKDKNTLWYEFEKGWLESSSIAVFSNKIQAEHASQKALE